MAQAGFTPIQIYYSSTTTNAPSSGNLAFGELAINITDGKLFYKDNANVVQVIGYKLWPLTSVTGTLPVANGGTGVTSSTGTGSVVLSTTPTLVTPILGTPTSGVMTNVTGLPLTTGVTGTLPVANGGTGITSGTSGGVPYYSATGTLASSAALAASSLVIGGGAGVAPSTTTTGTGVLTALGVAANAATGFTTGSGTATLTNKRTDPRVTSAASASSLTPDVSAADMYAYTALAANLTINAPTGTPVNGNKLMFRILDNGTFRTLTWNATFTPIGVVLPTTTTANKTVYVGCIYNAANTRWDVIAVTTQA